MFYIKMGSLSLPAVSVLSDRTAVESSWQIFQEGCKRGQGRSFIEFDK